MLCIACFRISYLHDFIDDFVCKCYWLQYGCSWVLTTIQLLVTLITSQITRIFDVVVTAERIDPCKFLTESVVQGGKIRKVLLFQQRVALYAQTISLAKRHHIDLKQLIDCAPCEKHITILRRRWKYLVRCQNQAEHEFHKHAHGIPFVRHRPPWQNPG